jgi:hypothetical protein
MAQWHNGTMAQWHNGTMAQWHNGGTMAQWWHNGTMVAQWHNGGTMAQWHNGTMALFLRKRFPALASVLSEFIYRKLRSCSFAFIADLSDTLSPFPDKTGAIERSGDIRIQGLRIMLTMSAV